MSENNSKNDEKGKRLVRNRRFEDDDAYHPYRRPVEDPFEPSPSTSRAPPMARMPSRAQSMIPDIVPPRGHIMISPQFSMPSPQDFEDHLYSMPSTSGSHRVPSRAPPPTPPAASSTQHMAFGESCSGSFQAPPATASAAPPNRELHEQYPKPGGHGDDSSSGNIVAPREINALVTLLNKQYPKPGGHGDDSSSGNIVAPREINALVTLLNKQYPKPGGHGDDSSSGNIIAPREINALVTLLNKLQQKRNRVTSTITSADSGSDEASASTELGEVQNGGPSTSHFPKESFTSSDTEAMPCERQSVFNDQPSTSHQPSVSGAQMRNQAEYDDDDSTDDEENLINQTPRRVEAAAQETADVFGNYLASCLKDMKGKARVEAERKIFDCLNNLRTITVKPEVVDIISPPASPVVTPRVPQPPVQESAARTPVMNNGDPDVDSRLFPPPIPFLPRSAQQSWLPQQQWSPRQIMHQWQQQQNFANLQDPVTTIYSQIHPSYVESILWVPPPRPRPPQAGPQPNMFFPLQRMFQPPQSMSRTPFPLTSHTDFFNQPSDYPPFFDDWDQMF